MTYLYIYTNSRIDRASAPIIRPPPPPYHSPFSLSALPFPNFGEMFCTCFIILYCSIISKLPCHLCISCHKGTAPTRSISPPRSMSLFYILYISLALGFPFPRLSVTTVNTCHAPVYFNMKYLQFFRKCRARPLGAFLLSHRDGTIGTYNPPTPMTLSSIPSPWVRPFRVLFATYIRLLLIPMCSVSTITIQM